MYSPSVGVNFIGRVGMFEVTKSNPLVISFILC